MQFVKTHWISLLCGVAALAGIAIAVLGMMNDDVIQDLEKRKQAAAEIRNLRSDPQNEATIKAEKERGKKFEAQYEEVVATAERINKKRPLLEGVFPKPAQLADQYRFREVYLKAIYDLPRQMQAGGLPTEAELRDAAEVLAEIERRKRQEAGESDEVAPPPTGFAPPSGGFTPPSGMGRGRMAPPSGGGRMAPGMGRGRMAPPGGGGRMAPGMGGGRMAPPGGGGRLAGGGQTPPGLPASGMNNLDVSQEKVVRRAMVKKATSIRVYAAAETSLHISPIAYTKDAPTPRSMWYAQVGLWIQDDIVRAIARLNDEVAQRLGDDEQPCVVNMPVKRLESVRVLGYIRSDGVPVPFPIAGQGSSEAALQPSFTGRRSTEQFDVVRVAVTVIVDERDLLRLIDSITRSNFYQLVDAEYSLVQVDSEGRDAEGYMYGPAPVIRAVLDFEGYMARKLFKDKMPAEVLVDLGITKADGQGG